MTNLVRIMVVIAFLAPNYAFAQTSDMYQYMSPITPQNQPQTYVPGTMDYYPYPQNSYSWPYNTPEPYNSNSLNQQQCKALGGGYACPDCAPNTPPENCKCRCILNNNNYNPTPTFNFPSYTHNPYPAQQYPVTNSWYSPYPQQQHSNQNQNNLNQNNDWQKVLKQEQHQTKLLQQIRREDKQQQKLFQRMYKSLVQTWRNR